MSKERNTLEKRVLGQKIVDNVNLMISTHLNCLVCAESIE